MLTGPIYKNIGPEFCVRGCDIARACTMHEMSPSYNILYIVC